MYTSLSEYRWNYHHISDGTLHMSSTKSATQLYVFIAFINIWYHIYCREVKDGSSVIFTSGKDYHIGMVRCRLINLRIYI